jgi:hypothetical protein
MLIAANEGLKMKRFVRVATVFTGSFACAAGAAPMAGAATAAVRPDTLTAGNCADNSGPAVHLYYSKKAHHSLAACIKGTHSGYFSFPGGKKFAGICGGAWSGTFYYGVPGTSISGSANFSPGYLPSFWKQTDIIYGVRLDRYDYIQSFTSCPNHGS